MFKLEKKPAHLTSPSCTWLIIAQGVIFNCLCKDATFATTEATSKGCFDLVNFGDHFKKAKIGGKLQKKIWKLFMKFRKFRKSIFWIGFSPSECMWLRFVDSFPSKWWSRYSRLVEAHLGGNCWLCFFGWVFLLKWRFSSYHINCAADVCCIFSLNGKWW